MLARITALVKSHLGGTLAVGAVIAFIAKSTGALLTFLLSVLVGRLLGAEQSGLFYLSLTIINIAVVFATFGLDTTVVRFSSPLFEHKNWPQLRGLSRLISRIGLSSSLAYFVLVALAAPWLADFVFNEKPIMGLLWIMSPCIPLIVMGLLRTEFLRSAGRITEATSIQNVVLPGITIILVFLQKDVIAVGDIAYSYLWASALSFLIAMYIAKGLIPAGQEVIPADKRKILKTAWPLMWIAAVGIMMGWVDTVMLGIWLTAADVGIYNAAMRIAMLTAFLLTSVNIVLAPRMASLHHAGAMDALQRLFQKVVLIMLFLASLVIAFVILARAELLGFFGNEFKQGEIALIILAFGQFINAVTVPVGTLLMMSGHEKKMLRYVLVFTIANIIMNIIFIPRWGIEGAAVASAIALGSLNITCLLYAKRKLGIIHFKRVRALRS